MLEMIPIDTFFSLKRFAHKDLWAEGKPIWSPLLLLNQYLGEKKNCQIEIEIHKGIFLEGAESISIGKGTIIEPGVYIQGPCVIGKNCVIRHGAYIRGGVICGDGCQIGHSAEIKHSILLDGACATHFVYVGDSILGNGVNLGAGVKCANLRLDRREVGVMIEGKRVKTGLRKFGCVVGDRTQIGCNSVLNPGTLVGMECLAFPLSNLSGSISPRSQMSAEGIKPIEPKLLEKLLWQSTTTAPA